MVGSRADRPPGPEVRRLLPPGRPPPLLVRSPPQHGDPRHTRRLRFFRPIASVCALAHRHTHILVPLPARVPTQKEGPFTKAKGSRRRLLRARACAVPPPSDRPGPIRQAHRTALLSLPSDQARPSPLPSGALAMMRTTTLLLLPSLPSSPLLLSRSRAPFSRLNPRHVIPPTDRPTLTQQARN